MMRYFFHKRIQGAFKPDLDGLEFKSFTDACLHAINFVRCYAYFRLIRGDDIIQIADEDGEVLKTISFDAVLRTNGVVDICKLPPKEAA